MGCHTVGAEGADHMALQPDEPNGTTCNGASDYKDGTEQELLLLGADPLAVNE